MKSIRVLAVLLLVVSLAGAQDKLSELLRKGIVEEEAEQNLDKAVQTFQAILTQFDQGRATAATALFHLAECYRKQGKKDQAIAAYRRITKEFADQDRLASASRSHLSKTYGLGQEPFVTVSPKIVEEQRRYSDARQLYRALLLEEIDLLEQQLSSYEKKVNAGIISSGGPEMTGLRRDILELKRTLAAFDAGAMPAPSPTVKK